MDSVLGVVGDILGEELDQEACFLEGNRGVGAD
jgi:hypothetical protein